MADNAASTAGTGGQAGIQADPCYHEWCDTVFNLSQYGLDEFTDVLAHGHHSRSPASAPTRSSSRSDTDNLSRPPPPPPKKKKKKKN